MFLEIEDIFFTILYTMVYTIVSMYMGFRLTEILNGDDGSIEKLARHFILWPIECLFILVISIKIYFKEKYYKIKK